MHIKQSPYMNAALRGHLADSFNTQLNKFPRIDLLIGKTQEEIGYYLKKNAPISTLDLAALVSEIAMVEDYGVSLKVPTIEMIFLQVGPEQSLDLISYLVNYHRDEFQNILSVYAQSKLKLQDTKLTIIINKLINSDSDYIDTFAQKWIAEALSVNPPLISKGNPINAFFAMVDPRHLPRIAAKVISAIDTNCRHEEMAKLLTVLSTPAVSQVFINEWLMHVQNRWSSYKQLIVKLTVHLHRNKVFPRPLSQLLNAGTPFHKNEYDQKLAEHIKQYCTLDQQAYLLYFASPDLCKSIAHQYAYSPASAAKLLKQAIQLQKNPSSRKALVQTFTYAQFASRLKEYYSKCVKAFDWKLLPYLFLVTTNNPEYSFLHYFNALNVHSRTRLLKRMHLANPQELELIASDLKPIGTLHRFLKGTSFYIPSDEIEISFNDICINLRALLAGIAGRNQSIETIDYWEAVPPVFLTFGLFDNHFRTTILESFCYMNSVQRESVAAMLSATYDFQGLDLIFSCAVEDKIYDHMPSEALSLYCEDKLNLLEEKTAEFYPRYAKYKKTISAYINKEKSEAIQEPSTEVFSYLNDEFVSLTNLFKVAETAPYQKLFRILSKKIPENLSSAENGFVAKMGIAKKLQDTFTSKSYGKVLTQLENWFPSLKPVEEKGLSDHFIGMLTPMVQQNLGLNNVFEGLHGAGITSTNDLITLGYDQDKEDLLQSVSVYILDNIPRGSNQMLANDCEDEWRSIYSQPFNAFFDSRADSFITHSTLLEQPQKFLIEITTRVLSGLQKLSLMDAQLVDCKDLENLQMKLASPNDDATVREVCKHTLTLFMNTYRHHIIPIVGRYLKQKSLDSCWETLRSQGYESLASLQEMGFISHRDCLFDMQALVNTLFPPAVAHA